MDLSQQDKQHIEHIAEDTLDKFETVAIAAQKVIHDKSGIGVNSIADMNTMTSTEVVQTLEKINKANRESCEKLAREPAIARVVAVDESDQQHTYFICRTTPVSGVPNLASYRSPVGRLASLPVAAEFTLPSGTIEVLENAKLNPSVVDQEWDSRNTVIEGEQFGFVTIESLRALLGRVAGVKIEEDLLGQLLAEEAETVNIIKGKRRSVITKMGLRDQPVLDQYQDEIFRLPLDNRLLILGPPGTGKTTTLIRRLGQKLDIAFLGEDEQQLIESVDKFTGTVHTDSWLMFTPTELLKQYLKEAFARERVPASDLRIRTWSDYRRELARNVFGVLRTATSKAGFVLKEDIKSIDSNALDKPIPWFSEFNEWQKIVFIDELRKSARGLSGSAVPEIAIIGKRLLEIIEAANIDSMARTFGSSGKFVGKKVEEQVCRSTN